LGDKADTGPHAPLGSKGVKAPTMHRDFWRLTAWLLVLSAMCWSAVALRSCGRGGPLRATELRRAEGAN
jgi:hypothetical protein